MPELVTPTGRLVLDHTASREAWLTERRGGIGSSDLPAILNLYRSLLHVYHDKRGNLPLDSDDWSEPAHFGTLFEAPLAHDWARRNRTVVEPVGLVAHQTEDWQRCSLDRLCTECPLDRTQRQLCALEVKCRDKMTANLWRQGPPDDVLGQVLWQILVTGLDHIHVVCLIGGNDYRQFTVRRSEHEKLVAFLDATAARLWFEHILPGVPPELTGGEPSDALIELYQRLHPDRDGSIVMDRDLDARDHVTDYLAAVADASDAERRRKAAYARMLLALGDAQAATVDNKLFYSVERSHRRTADLDRLREEFPDAYAACVVDKPSDRINIPRYVREEHAA